MRRCHECEHYNHGHGGKPCLKCHKYLEIIRNSNKRNTIQIDVIPQNILEAITEDLDPRTVKVLNALSTLPAQHSAIIILLFFGGFTHEQVASLLNMSSKNVQRKKNISLDIIRKLTE